VATEINESGDEDSRVEAGESWVKSNRQGEDGTTEAEGQEDTEVLGDGPEGFRWLEEQSWGRGFPDTQLLRWGGGWLKSGEGGGGGGRESRPVVRPEDPTNSSLAWFGKAIVPHPSDQEAAGGDGDEDLEAVGVEEDREVGREDGGEADEVVREGRDERGNWCGEEFSQSADHRAALVGCQESVGWAVEVLVIARDLVWGDEEILRKGRGGGG
jgi:hypothetical protein